MSEQPLQTPESAITSVMQSITGLFGQEFFQLSFWFQLGLIAFAILIAAYCSSSFGKSLSVWSKHIKLTSWLDHVWRFALALSARLVFSLVAASVLALSVYVVQAIHILPADSKLTVIRIGYSIFYAWAILVVLIEIFAVLMGTKQFSPRMRKIFYTIFWALAALNIFGILPDIVETMKSIQLPIGSDKLNLWTLTNGLITVVLSIIVARWLASLIDKTIQSAQDFEPNLKVVLSRLTYIGLITLAILFSLSSVGIDLTILSVFGGAVGVGLGFGLQKIASNYISGFIILFDKSVKIGDMIEVSGFSGKISQINTRYSVLRNLTGEEMIIPNETLVTSNVKNFSRTERAVSHFVEVAIGYECDVEQACKIMVEIVSGMSRIDPIRKPTAVMTGFGADGVNLRVSFWVLDPENGVSVLKSTIMKEILTRFNEENISIPYAIRDIHMSGELTVKSTN